MKPPLSLLRHVVWTATLSILLWALSSAAAANEAEPLGHRSIFSADRFTAIETVIPDSSMSSEWGDYDNDGDWDVMVSCNRRSHGFAVYDCTSNFWDWATPSGDGLESEELKALGLPLDCGSGVIQNLGNGAFLAAQVDHQDSDQWLVEDAENSLVTVSDGKSYIDIDDDGDLDVISVECQKLVVKLNSYLEGGRSYRELEYPIPDELASSLHFFPRSDFGETGVGYCIARGGGDPHEIKILKLIPSLFTRSSGFLVETQSWSGRIGLTHAADLDSDGALDLIFEAEQEEGANELQVHRNNGDGLFVLQTRLEMGIYRDALEVETGDMDSDGDLDLLVLGRYGELLTFENCGELGFVQREHGFQVASYTQCFDLIDFDRDGDLDVFISGAIYRNDDSRTNTPPSAPMSLANAVGGSQVELEWEPVEDDTTPTNGITYNLSLRNLSAGAYVVAPLSFSDGRRKVPGPGNLSTRRTWTSELPEGVYEWTVQAIDALGNASAFAPRQRFVISKEGYQEATIRKLDESIEVTWTVDILFDSQSEGFGSGFLIDYLPGLKPAAEWQTIGKVDEKLFLDTDAARVERDQGFYRVKAYRGRPSWSN